MAFKGWAVSLNDIMLSSSCGHSILDWDSETCGDRTFVTTLTEPPDGLGLPALRTEDVTFAQRDGVRHYSDWYEPRTVTLQATIGAGTGCTSCLDTRQQLNELIKAWRRSCCDVELVIYTPCNGDYIEGEPILGQQMFRRNLVRNPSFEDDLKGWSTPMDSFCRGYDRCYTEDAGTTWCYSQAITGDFTTSREIDGGYVGTDYMRLTCVTPPTTPGVGFTYGQTGVPLIEVEGSQVYSLSAYLRASDTQQVVPQIIWVGAGGVDVTVGSTVVVNGGQWERVSMLATAPSDAEFAYVQFVTLNPSDWSAADTLDIDAALFEEAETLMDYFDGDTADIEDPPVIGNRVVLNGWAGNPNLSISVQSIQVYEENFDRTLYGPVGIVGRPRAATYNWLPIKKQMAEVTLRFDAIDERMYLLDECGTPGYQQCRTIQPGFQQSCRSYDRCYGEQGMCYSAPTVFSVLPVTVPVRGTERVNPLIVLENRLTSPVIENVTSGEFIVYNGVVDGERILIDTENGTAVSEYSGQSFTHLLGGSIFLSATPGNNEFRVYTQSSNDTGNVSVCWRDTVVSI